MDLFNQFGIDIGYVIIGMAGVILLLFILLIVTMVKDAGTRKKYRKFMDGENGKNLEKAILDKNEDTLRDNTIRKANINKEGIEITTKAIKDGLSSESNNKNTKYCIECGKKIPTDAKFCLYCGKEQ